MTLDPRLLRLGGGRQRAAVGAGVNELLLASLAVLAARLVLAVGSSSRSARPAR
jgi:hypothetical protein